MPVDRLARAVVVNADDLGLSASVNRAIAEAFDRNLISSTSLLANLPPFGDAVATARGRPWMERIGVHLNLSDGAPLTPGIRSFPRLCGANGQLCMKPSTRFRLSNDEAAVIEQELAAQISACLEAGVRPTHLDSHGHTHTQWPVATIVIRLARRYSIPVVRLSRNCGPSPGLAKALYKQAFNARLRGAGLARVRYFGSVTDSMDVVRRGLGPVEVMVHPALGADGALIDALDGESLESVLGRLNLADRLTGFDQLAAPDA